MSRIPAATLIILLASAAIARPAPAGQATWKPGMNEPSSSYSTPAAKTSSNPAPKASSSSAASASPNAASNPSAAPMTMSTPAEEVPLAPEFRTISAGTELKVDLVNSLSSRNSRAGDLVTARLVSPIIVDGSTVVPTNAILHGSVTEAVPGRFIFRKPLLAVRFNTIQFVDGSRAPISAQLYLKGRTAIMGGVGTASNMGGPISRVEGVATRRTQLQLSAGTPVDLYLESPVQVKVHG
jgi:hypothetical protein